MLSMPALALVFSLFFKSVDSPVETPPPTPTATPQTIVTKPEVSILDKINAYRHEFGLSPVQEDPHTCAYAELRAAELTNSFSHEGSPHNYPSYSIVTENIAMTNNPNEVVDLWINSPGHAENMRQDTPHVCVKNIGPYYAYEGWRP